MRIKVQPNSVFAELDGDRAGIAAALQNWHRKFTTRQKACFLAIEGSEIGLGENLQDILTLESTDHGTEIEVWPEGKDIECIGEVKALRWRYVIARISTNGLGISGGELVGADRSDRIRCASAQKIDTELHAGTAVQLGELDVQHDLLLNRRGSKLEVGNNSSSHRNSDRNGAVGDFFARDATDQGDRIPCALDTNIFVGEGFAEELADWIDIVFHGDVVHGSGTGFGPDDNGRRPMTLAVKEEFFGSSGDRIDNFGARSGDTPNFDWVVDDEALADSHAEVDDIHRLGSQGGW